LAALLEANKLVFLIGWMACEERSTSCYRKHSDLAGVRWRGIGGTVSAWRRSHPLAANKAVKLSQVQEADLGAAAKSSYPLIRDHLRAGTAAIKMTVVACLDIDADKPNSPLSRNSQRDIFPRLICIPSNLKAIVNWLQTAGDLL
jgi:hypothetical protein